MNILNCVPLALSFLTHTEELKIDITDPLPSPALHLKHNIQFLFFQNLMRPWRAQEERQVEPQAVRGGLTLLHECNGRNPERETGYNGG